MDLRHIALGRVWVWPASQLVAALLYQELNVFTSPSCFPLSALRSGLQKLKLPEVCQGSGVQLELL